MRISISGSKSGLGEHQTTKGDATFILNNNFAKSYYIRVSPARINNLGVTEH